MTKLQCIAASIFLSGAAVSAAQQSLAASYRKDFFLPYNIYPEAQLPDPSLGGRLHVVGPALSAGNTSSTNGPNCFVNGVYANMSVGLDPKTQWPIDWIRVEPVGNVAVGDPVFVSFHSREAVWDQLANSSTPASLLCLNAQGAALLNGTFSVYVPPLPITWVTTADNFATVYMHLLNNDTTSSHRATAIVLNGVDVTSYITNASLLVVPVGAAVMWSVPATALPMRLAAGVVWTLEVSWAELPGAPSVAGGQFFREFFPIQTWECTSDCPFPGVNDWGYAQHRSSGVDTFFLYDGSASEACGGPPGITVLNELAPAYGFNVLVTPTAAMNPGTVTNASGLAGWFLSDEGDQNIDDGLRNILQQTFHLHGSGDGVPTYMGGSRNRYTGLYAGITDIKGMDLYIAACAPHVTEWGFPPPLRGSYDYVRNTRENQMPLPAWTYSQVFDSSWDSYVDRQPNAAEIAVSVMSVLASGAKGVDLFQTNLKYVNSSVSGASWAAMGALLREAAALRDTYRVGDITGMTVARA